MTAQIAVKLPAGLLAAVDRLVREGRFESRSAAVRAGLDLVARRAHDEDIDRAFAAGFRERPEDPHELADATRLAIESINDEPWERWW